MTGWDEKLRGPQMSSTSGRVIHKYQMPVLEEFTMSLPAGARILRVQDQGGMFWMWLWSIRRSPTNRACSERSKLALPSQTTCPLAISGFAQSSFRWNLAFTFSRS